MDWHEVHSVTSTKIHVSYLNGKLLQHTRCNLPQSSRVCDNGRPIPSTQRLGSRDVRNALVIKSYVAFGPERSRRLS